MKRLSTWLLFWGSAALLLVIVAGYAEATNEWQQVSGNATTELTTGSNPCIDSGLVRCANVTLNAGVPYYIVSAYKDTSQGPSGGKWTLNVASNTSLQGGDCGNGEVLFSVINLTGTPTLIDQTGDPCSPASTSLLYTSYSSEPNSMWNAVRVVSNFTLPVVISRSPDSDYFLTGWTETGTNGLIQRARGFGQPDVIGYIFEENNTPGAPVLTGQIVESRNVLTWTTPAGGAITGYNITRTDVYGTYVAHVGLVNTWDEGSTTRNRSYTVTAWGPGGNGTPSNVVTLQLPPVDLFGDTGAIYGGNKTVLAAAVGVPELGLDLLMSLLLILVFTVAGIMLTPAHRLIGGGGGAVAGLFITLANDLIPIWVLVFMVAAAAAGFLLIRRRSRGGMP